MLLSHSQALGGTGHPHGTFPHASSQSSSPSPFLLTCLLLQGAYLDTTSLS